MKYKTERKVIYYQLFITLIFLLMTFSNELFDFPHLIFGDQATSISQRIGEVIIEIFIFIMVAIIQIFILKKLFKRIKILEGFLSTCSNCKKIRYGAQWQQIEKYISEHSLAEFTHTLCPDCLENLYPELCLFKDVKNTDSLQG
ncbi:MAG: hypothetical protein MRK02_15075 [Candidatus Scalindua sp.]|nr:hypothetical protein [Candidatus Scalindua sp.]